MDEDTNIETSNLIPRATAPYVTPTKPRLEKRKDTKTTGQPNAQPDLRFISEPKDSTLSSTTDYVFDNSAGVGITVYVIDTGANPSNPDFSGMPGTTRWLWPTESWWNLFLNSAFRQPFGAQTDTANHGCCVISKVAGIFYGVAKRANIVVVKAITSSRPGFEKRILRMSIIKSLSLVQEDVERLAKSTNPQDRVNGKATLNMSFGVALDDTSTTDLWFITKFEQAVQALLALDVVVVIAAGNARVSISIGSIHAEIDQLVNRHRANLQAKAVLKMSARMFLNALISLLVNLSESQYMLWRPWFPLDVTGDFRLTIGTLMTNFKITA